MAIRSDSDIRVTLSPDGTQVVIGALREVGAAAQRYAMELAKSMVMFLPKTMQAIDEQLKLARQLRATTTGLETLKRAASLAGVEEKQLSTATRNLDVRMGEAAQGAKGPKEALDRLGISISHLASLDADERIALINQKLRENVPAAERAAIAGELFGTKVAAAMGRITGEDLETAREEVLALGLAVSEVDAQTIERANDAFSVMGEVARGAANRVTVALAPVLEAVAQQIRKWAIESEGFKKEIEEALDIAVTMAGFTADAFRGLHVVFKMLQLAGQEWMAFIVSQLGKLPRFVADVLDGMVAVINANIRNLNMLPGINIPELVLKGHDQVAIIFEGVADSIRETAQTTREELENLVNKPLPSEGLRAMVDQVKAAADEISRQQIAQRKANEFQGGVVARDPEAEKRLEALRESLRTEEEKERESHAKRERELLEFRRKRLLTEQGFNELTALEAARHEEAMRAITDKRDAQWQRVRDQRMADIQNLEEFLMTENEQELAAHQKRLEQLVAAAEELNMTEERYRQLREELETKHQAKMGDLTAQGTLRRKRFEEMNAREQTKTLFGEMESVTAGVAQHNRKLFELNKVAGIANAIISAYEGISRTLSAYPYPWNIAMAALHGVAAFAQVAAIRRTTFSGNGGGAAPALSGGTPATPVSPVSPSTANATSPGQTTVIQFMGTEAEQRLVRRFAQMLNENNRDGGRVLIS